MTSWLAALTLLGNTVTSAVEPPSDHCRQPVVLNPTITTDSMHVETEHPSYNHPSSSVMAAFFGGDEADDGGAAQYVWQRRKRFQQEQERRRRVNIAAQTAMGDE